MDSDDGGQKAGLGSDDADLGSNDAEGAELPPVGADEKNMTGTKRRVVGAPDPSRCGVPWRATTPFLRAPTETLTRKHGLHAPPALHHPYSKLRP